MIAKNKKKAAEMLLRLGLAVSFIYSGQSLYFNPQSWRWVIDNLPGVFQQLIGLVGVDAFLQTQGIGELVLAFLLLVWFLPRWVTGWTALLLALKLAAIVLLIGVNQITFRDLGLLGAALALVALSTETVRPQTNFKPQKSSAKTPS